MAAGITFKLGGVLDPTFKGAMAESVAEAKAAAAAQAAAYQKSAIALERQIVLAKKEGFSYVETTAALRALNAERTKLMLMPHGITEAGIISTVTSSQRGNLSKDAAIESGAAVDVSMLGLYKARRAAHAADEAEIARYETALAEGGRRTVATLGSANAAEEAAWAVKFAEAKARVAARKQLEKEGIDWALTQKAAQGAIWTEQSVAAGKMLAGFEQERIAAKAASAEMKVEQLATLAAVAKGGTASAFGHGGGAGGGISGIMRETLVIFREIGRGNMTRVPGSLLLLLQYTGMLNLMMKSEKTEALLAAAAQEKLAVSTARSAMAAEAKLRAAKIKAGVDVRSPELQTAEAEAAMATSAAQEKRAASTALAAGWDTKSTEAAAANIVALEAERDAAIKDGIAQTLKAKETAAAAAVVKASAAQSLVAIGLMVLPILLLVAAIVSWYIAIKSLVDWMHKKNAALKESMEFADKYRTTVAEQIDAEEKVAEAIKKTTDALRKMNEAKNQSVELTRDAIDAAKEEADANEKLYDAKTKGKLLDISIAEKKGEITHEQGIHQRATIERQAVADKAAAKQDGLDNAAKITSDAAAQAKKDAATAQERARITGDAAANSPLISQLSDAEKIKKVAAEEADKARKAQEDALTLTGSRGRKQKLIDAEKHNEERQEAAEKSAEALIKRLRDKMSPGEISASEAMTQADEATAASKTLDEQAKKAGTAAATNAKNSPAEVAAEQSNISKQEELDLAKEKKPEERGGGRSATERERVGVGAPQVANLQKQTLDVTKMQLIEARKLNTQMDLLIKSGRGNNDLNNF